VIERRRAQRSFGDGLIAEEVRDLYESWMPHADQVLADPEIGAAIYEALAKRHPQSRTRGRRGAPAEVVLRLLQYAAWLMIRRRAKAAGIDAPIGNHTFRATGITAYLANGGALEHAQEMAAHESPRTTKLYDRTKERLTQDEVERIRL
jgi:integrase